MLVGKPFLRIRAFIFPIKPSPCPVLTNSNRLRNSADKRSLTSPLATATTNGRVLLQLGEVRPAAIISSITSSGTGVGRKSRVDLREAAKVLKFSASKSLFIILLNGDCYFICSFTTASPPLGKMMAFVIQGSLCRPSIMPAIFTSTNMLEIISFWRDSFLLEKFF